MTVVRANPLRAEDGDDDWEDTEGFVMRSSFVAFEDIPGTIRSSRIHAPYLEVVFGNGGSGPAD